MKNIKIAEQKRKDRDAAMPSVKVLVKKYGRQIIQGCINNLREYEKMTRRLEEAKQEVARLEKKV